MDNLALGVIVFLIAWYIMKRFWKKSPDAPANAQAASDNKVNERSMPRYGTPGTVTKAQRERLKAEGFEPSHQWSVEEANIVLDTVIYLRGVWGKAVSRDEAPLEIQNHLLGFILTDTEMREYIRRWGTELREKGPDGKPSFPRTKIFERVASEAQRLRGS